MGLGDLILKDKERPQANAGRLDLLLQDPETLKRYEVEIQLGATAESHIIRAIEYWDIERKRYPQYEHAAAVIVAEEITARFLNVIQLFNGGIPLIALKMTAYKVGDEYALQAEGKKRGRDGPGITAIGFPALFVVLEETGGKRVNPSPDNRPSERHHRHLAEHFRVVWNSPTEWFEVKYGFKREHQGPTSCRRNRLGLCRRLFIEPN